MRDLLVALDQGTTVSTAAAFDGEGGVCKIARREVPQHFPGEGQVEHDPEDLWRTSCEVLREIFAAFPGRIAALGIANQRETTLIWDRRSGATVHRAIVWQDRRTAGDCDALRRDGVEEEMRRRTGLCLDPYFSASKIAWILNHVAGVRARAEAGALAFGTVDSFLIHRLTGGKRHVTDIANASRTGLYNIHERAWDDELLRIFGVPRALLPEVCESAGDFGVCDPSLFGEATPIAGVAGDQQAAAIGQGCVRPGMVKSAYGTGCFVLACSGSQPPASADRLLSTIASSHAGRVAYALEGAIFNAGSAVQWLRDALGLIDSADETEALARSAPVEDGVYLVPAFTGLGAPYWDAGARGALIGLKRDSGRASAVRATLESAAYQTADLLAAMRRNGVEIDVLRVDGGMTRNDWLCQFLADILDVTTARPENVETTAWGAAFLAGLGIGRYRSLDEADALWRCDREFKPNMSPERRRRALDGWADAVSRVLSR